MTVSNMKTIIASLASGLLAASLVTTAPAFARDVGARLGISAATSTTTIPLQVRIATSSGAPISGLRTLNFSLYSAASGGSALWTETWTAANAVQVTDGVASVLLGSRTALPQSVIANNSTLYLGITVDVEAEMQPRVQLGSAPIAFTVKDGGVGTSSLADGAITTAKISDGSVSQSKAPTLLRASAILANGGQNWKFLTGTWCATLTAGQYKPVTVSFVDNFASPPFVLAQVTGNGNPYTTIHVSVSNTPSTSGTDIYIYSEAAQTLCGHYIAMGPG